MIDSHTPHQLHMSIILNPLSSLSAPFHFPQDERCPFVSSLSAHNAVSSSFPSPFSLDPFNLLSSLSTYTMTTLRVGCVVDGESTSFAIKISSKETVSELKDGIKRTLSPRYDNIPAMDLILWRVEIPDEVEILTKDKARDDEEGVPTKDGIILAKNMDVVRSSDNSTYSARQLSPSMRIIGRFFPEHPTADVVHVIVQPPASGNATHCV